MPSNADVNVTPSKTSVTGATSGYLKTADGASSFEVVSQIPAEDVEGGGSSDTWIEGSDLVSLSGSTYFPLTSSTAPGLYAAWQAHPSTPVIISSELTMTGIPSVTALPAVFSIMAVTYGGSFGSSHTGLVLVASTVSGGTPWNFTQGMDSIKINWAIRVSS